MKAVCLTDRGKVRQHNEDSCGIFTNKDGISLVIVADGMGGHNAGDVASKMTTSLIQSFWEETANISTPEIAESWLFDTIGQVNTAIFQHSLNNQECSGMGTTSLVAICTPTFSTIAHIGDSRCYVKNISGFKQITEDHTLVNELVRSGQISKEDAEHHPRKNVILRALGTEQKIEMDIMTLILEDGDYMLLCTDGLSNKVSEDDMDKILQSDRSLHEKGETLIQLANDNGGEDNITIVIVDYSSECESG